MTGSARDLVGERADEDVLLLPDFGSTAAADFVFLGPMLGRYRHVLPLDATPGTASSGTDTGTATGTGTASGSRPLHVIGYGHGALAALVGVMSGDLQPTTLTLLAPVLTAPPSFPDDIELLSPTFRGLRPEVAPPSLDRERAAAELAEIAALADVDLAAFARRLRCPVLVLRCTDDVLAGPDDAERIVAAADDARLAQIDSGHAVLVERPAEVLALVAGFLDTPDAHPAGSVLRAVAG